MVRAGGVTAAAEHLGLTQPAVSMQVRELELELGAELLERGRAGVAVTPAGERLHALAEPLVRGVDALFADFAGSLDTHGPGRVRVAASSAGATFVAPRYVARFHARHPDTAVRLETMSSRSRLERLLEERVDLVLGAKEPHAEEALAYRELLTYHRVLICASDHPLAGRASVTPHEAVAYRAVVPPEGTYSRQFGEDAAQALGIVINAVVEVGGWGVLKRYVEAGFGVAAVPSLVLSETDRLAVAALEWDEPPRSFGVYARSDRHLTPAARRFLEVLIPNVSVHPPPPADSGTAPPGMRHARGRCLLAERDRVSPSLNDGTYAAQRHRASLRASSHLRSARHRAPRTRCPHPLLPAAFTEHAAAACAARRTPLRPPVPGLGGSISAEARRHLQPNARRTRPGAADSGIERRGVDATCPRLESARLARATCVSSDCSSSMRARARSVSVRSWRVPMKNATPASSRNSPTDRRSGTVEPSLRRPVTSRPTPITFAVPERR